MLRDQGIDGEFEFVDGAGAGTWDFVDESWGPRLDGRLINQFTGPNQPWVAHPDNVRNFFRTGMTSNTSGSLVTMLPARSVARRRRSSVRESSPAP